jgi:hypothetical protein
MGGPAMPTRSPCPARSDTSYHLQPFCHFLDPPPRGLDGLPVTLGEAASPLPHSGLGGSSPASTLSSLYSPDAGKPFH